MSAFGGTNDFQKWAGSTADFGLGSDRGYARKSPKRDARRVSMSATFSPEIRRSVNLLFYDEWRCLPVARRAAQPRDHRAR